MSKTVQICREVACALDPVAFAEVKLDFFPTEFQKHVLRSGEKRLIVLAHRQLGKTTVLAIKVLWMAVYRPRTLHLVVASGEAQSKELLRKVQDFSAMIPEVKTTEQSMSYVTFENKSRIICLSGREQSARGYSAPDTVTCDEASRCDDLLWSAILPMALRGNTTISLISTPNGQRGFFWKLWTDGGPEWIRFAMRADENSDISADGLAALKKMFRSERDYRQECLNSFESTEGQFIPGDLIRRAMTGLPGLVLTSTDYTTGRKGLEL